MSNHPLYDPENPVTGTIYDEGLPRFSEDPDVARWHRSCGLFYLHGVNPASVVGDADSVKVVRTESGGYKVVYKAIYLQPGESQWQGLNGQMPKGNELPIPSGVICDHGDGDPHKAQQTRAFDVTWEEVAR